MYRTIFPTKSSSSTPSSHSARGLSMLSRILICLFAISLAQMLVYAQRDSQHTYQEIVRLAPSSFGGLPKGVAKELTRRGCTIPQATTYNKKPHNVVSGSFRVRGQKDWAVLCSRNETSSILIFWAGSANAVSRIAA